MYILTVILMQLFYILRCFLLFRRESCISCLLWKKRLLLLVARMC